MSHDGFLNPHATDFAAGQPDFDRPPAIAAPDAAAPPLRRRRVRHPSVPARPAQDPRICACASARRSGARSRAPLPATRPPLPHALLSTAAAAPARRRHYICRRHPNLAAAAGPAIACVGSGHTARTQSRVGTVPGRSGPDRGAYPIRPTPHGGQATPAPAPDVRGSGGRRGPATRQSARAR